MTHKFTYLTMTSVGLLLLAPVFGVGPTFTPDSSFKGASLSGWHTLGQADWRAENGELIGADKRGGVGGWLVLDRSFQDVAFHASFRATGGAKSGLLLRAEKTAEGLK